MKRALCLFLALTVALLSGCSMLDKFGKDTPTEENIIPPTNTEKLHHVLSRNIVQCSPELVELFFDYYGDTHAENTESFAPHNMELRLLPSFDENTPPSWDDLTMFIYYFSDQDKAGPNGEKMFSRPSFDTAVKLFFNGLEYEHRSSGFLTLADGLYIPTGWDNHGSEYFHLKSIDKDENGVLSATFDQISFYEIPEDSNNSANWRVIFEEIRRRNPNGVNLESIDLMSVLRELITAENYAEIFEVSQEISISFTLSENPDYPLIYQSCKRTPKAPKR